MSQTLYVAVDTEATGVEPGSRLVELGAVAFLSSGEIVDVFDELVHPQMPMPADLRAIHGITDDDVADKADAAEVLRRFELWLPQAAVLVAHHAPFDINILGWEVDRLGGKWWPHPWLDSLEIARRLGETADNKLATIVAHHGWTLPGRFHRALSDAHAVRHLLLHGLSGHTGSPGKVAFPLNRHRPRWCYPRILPQKLSALWSAIQKGTRCEIEHVTPWDGIQKQILVPLGAATRVTSIHLHGWDPERQRRAHLIASRLRSFRPGIE